MRAANAVRGWRDDVARWGRLSTIVAVVQDDDAVREQQRVEEVVGDDDRRPVGQHPPQHPAEQRRGADVQRGHRLVEQQQARVGGERAGDGDPLRLTAGELRGPPGGELARLHLRPASRRAAPRACAVPAPAAARAEGDVVEHGQVREQQRILGEQGDAAARAAPAIGRGRPGPRSNRVRPSSVGAARVGAQQRRRGRTAAWTCRRRWARAARRVSPGRARGRRRSPRGGDAWRRMAEQSRAASRSLGRSPTTTTATTTSTSDSATAASASVSRCR